HPVELADREAITRVLLALCRFGHLRQRPLVLCFDQVDNLEHDQVGALARFLHGLIDRCPNLLVIVSGVQEALRGFKDRGVISAGSWDRLARDTVLLRRPSSDEGCRLLEARLRDALGAFAGLPEVAELVRRDALFPLGHDWYVQKAREHGGDLR